MDKNLKVLTGIKKFQAEWVMIITFLFCYLVTFLWMWDRWFARDTYYSHGLLVPFVTAFFIWQKREELMQLVTQRNPLGLILICLGVFLHIVSSILRVYFTSGFSMLIVLIGLILHFYGPKVLKKILFPICFLFFMFPLPLVIIVNISFKMKLFAATIATKVLNQIGLSAIQEGSIILMSHTEVVVDDVCSGLRSLISLMALGSIFAYWMKGLLLKRIFLFLMTIPIAVITNVCRVVLLSSVSEIWGTNYAKGFIHNASGFLVFALAFIMLYAIGKLIE